MSKTSIARQFSKASTHYDNVAIIQRDIAIDLVNSLLANILDKDKIFNILELGCGTGFLTYQLLELFKNANIHATDISSGMIKHMLNNQSKICNINPFHENNPNNQVCYDRIQLEVCDVTQCEFSKKYDLIVSSSALHWMQPLSALFYRLGSACSKGSVFCFALMVDGTFDELRYIRNNIAPQKPLLWHFPRISEILDSLKSVGFELSNIKTETKKCCFESVDEFFHTLKTLGVNGRMSHFQCRNVHNSDTHKSNSHSIILNRSELKSLAKQYDIFCKKRSNCVFATYEVCIISAYSTK